ncbi:type III secretion system protein [Pseudomonas syringae]|uniref:Type III secretion system protein n=1 Tax=Pseudomonas syringae TaxID=317 RepID=A0A244EQW0_PSESX|nr:FliM/FliN family flagellar motor switch protein [Pseudomonas syringae]OUM06933.1 type III secretion system protein [Pseudomonas syringae]
MSTEDLYEDDVASLDDDDEQTGDHEQHWQDAHAEQQPGDATLEESFEDDQHDEPPRSPALDTLALDLTLRCGELRLTLAELRKLGAGTVLEVTGVAPGFATLCHGERVVAEGELVDVDGRLGLQITRLAAPA